jgi:endoglycosylceramidase
LKRICTDGISFRNQNGDHMILNGINLVCKDKELNYVGNYSEETFKSLRDLGFNVLRLGIIWDGVEPKPGIYDNGYLDKIKHFVKLAEKYDLYVFLDMHQDLYSCKFGDGAPEWAALTDGLPHIQGEMWSDAYLISPALKRCFDNFWNNTAVEDGIGLQDHYANAWKHVVSRFKDCENVIGYDIMNEPCMGSDSEKVFQALLAAYGTNVMKLQNLDMDRLAALWMDESKKAEILEGMADMEIYKQLILAAQKESQSFEKEKLTPFFSKVTASIREIDPDGIIFLETSYFSNMGMESYIDKVKDSSGHEDMLQSFAPHGYDLVVDTDKYSAYNKDRVALIFNTHRKVQQRLGIPTLVGEWGGFADIDITYDLAVHVIKIFEKYLWSNTFWCYFDSFEKCKFTKALKRAYPQSVNGTLSSYNYDYDNGSLRVEYHECAENISPAVIYHPKVASLKGENIKFAGQTSEVTIKVFEGSMGGYVYISPSGKSGYRTIVIG